MKDHEHARLLLAMAHKDLKALGGMLNVEVFGPEVFGFHAQQAVEKATKAWLSALGLEYSRVHDLGELFAAVQAAGHVVPKELSSLEDLTDFAVQYRHEAFDDLGQGIDRPRILDLVRRFVEHVERLLA